MLFITEEQKSRIKKIADTEIEKFIEDLPQIIFNVLQGAILSLLGIKKEWDGYKVDTPSHRPNPVMQLIENAVKDILPKVTFPTIETALNEIATNQDFLKSVSQRTIYNFKRSLEHGLEDAAKEFAKIQANIVSKGLMLKLDGIIPDNVDMSDPNSYDSKIGGLILKGLIENIMTQK